MKKTRIVDRFEDPIEYGLQMYHKYQDVIEHLEVTYRKKKIKRKGKVWTWNALSLPEKYNELLKILETRK